MKMKSLLLTVSILNSPIKPKASKYCLNLFKRIAILMGTTEQEIIEIATMLAMSRQSLPWMKSANYTKDQWT